MFYIEQQPPYFNQRQLRYKTLYSVIRSNCQHTKIYIVVYKCSKVTKSYLFILLHNVNRLSILRIPGRTLFHVYTSISLFRLQFRANFYLIEGRSSLQLVSAFHIPFVLVQQSTSYLNHVHRFTIYDSRCKYWLHITTGNIQFCDVCKIEQNVS